MEKIEDGGRGKRERQLQEAGEVIVVDVSAGRVVPVVLLGEGEDLLQAREVLEGAVGGLGHSQVNQASHEKTFFGPRIEEISRQRSEEHTSELQSRSDLVCRLLLEKKNQKELLGNLVLRTAHTVAPNPLTTDAGRPECLQSCASTRSTTSISDTAISFFFFNDTATTEIYTLSLHDALPISGRCRRRPRPLPGKSSLAREDFFWSANRRDKPP